MYLIPELTTKNYYKHVIESETLLPGYIEVNICQHCAGLGEYDANHEYFGGEGETSNYEDCEECQGNGYIEAN